MIKIKKTRSLLLLLNLLLSYSLSAPLKAAALIEVEDLSAFAFADGDVKAFNHPWAIIWGELLEPGHPLPEQTDGAIAPLRDFQDLPSLQKPGFAFDPKEGLGAGTFLHKIKGLKPNSKGYDFHLMGASTSSKICIFSEARPGSAICREIGTPSLDMEKNIPKVLSTVVTFYPESQEEVWVLLVQVSNYNSYTGGFRYGAPELSEGGILKSRRDKSNFHDFIAMGFLGAIMAYSFMIWARRVEDLASLALALLCIATIVRLMIATQLIYNYIPPTVWFFEFKYAAEYATLALGPIFYLWFVNEAFSEVSFPRIFKFYAIVACGLVLLPFFTSTIVFTKFLLPYQLYILASLLFGVTILVRSVIRGIEGCFPAVFGAILIASTTVYDMLVARGTLPYPFISQFGISFFMFLQGQVIAGRFATAFRTARRLSRSLQEEVDRQLAEIKEKTSEIRSVMDNIPEGIVYVTNDKGDLSQVRSNFLQNIFGSDHSIATINDLLDPTNLNVDEKAKISSILSSSLGESEFTWEINADHLPRTVLLAKNSQSAEADSKIIDLEWHPVFSERGETAKVLVTAHDVTKLRMIEQKAHEKTIEAQRLNEVIANKSFLLHRFFHSSDELLQSISEEWKRTSAISASGEVITKGFHTIYGSLHTIKGMARTLKFSDLSPKVHSAEEPLYQIVRGDKSKSTQPLSRSSVENLLDMGWPELFSAILTSYQNYRTIYENISREWGTSSNSALNAGSFAKEILEPELPLALELGKEIPSLKIEAADFVTSPMQTKILQQVYVHMIRNSLDHGLETAKERTEKGKRSRGEVAISLDQVLWQGHERTLHLRFQDDGKGINLDIIQSKAIEKGVLTPLEANRAQNIVMSMFKEGFSSREVVSEISGRGVGMGEIKRLIEMVGGTIDICPQKFSNWDSAALTGPGPHLFYIDIYLPAEAQNHTAA